MPGAPVTLPTEVVVIYADDGSFTFLTPWGHNLSAWITFSAYRDLGGARVAQAQALERTSDPLDELTYLIGGNKMNDGFWQTTLEDLASHAGVQGPVVETQIVCVDRRRHLRYVRNMRHSAVLRTAGHTLTFPVRRLTGRR